MATSQSIITPQHLEKAIGYDEYVVLSEQLFNDGRTTSSDAEYNTPEILNYAKLNLARMNRLNKTVEIHDALSARLKALPVKWIWVVLSESWCGDAAQNLPVLAKMTQLTSNISLKILLRDQHPELMSAYLSNGSRSIPKLVCLNAESLNEIGTWGPRPNEVQQKMNEWKDLPFDIKIEKVQVWYAQNQTEALQTEFTRLIEIWKNR
jgi:hypothetical protein